MSRNYRLLLGSGGLSTPERTKAWFDEVDAFLGPVRKVLFVPYAGKDHDAYLARMISLGHGVGRELVGIHTTKDPKVAVLEAEAIYVGGGNSFRLLHSLIQKGLIDPIRERVAAGIPYLGISAGSNMACPTLMTTNDMPIVQPASFKAIGLIPFQINPHYFRGSVFYEAEGKITRYGGETRDQRLNEFHEENDIPVLGLGEGTALLVESSKATLRGVGEARVFRRGQSPEDRVVGADMTDLF